LKKEGFEDKEYTFMVETETVEFKKSLSELKAGLISITAILITFRLRFSGTGLKSVVLADCSKG